MAELCFNSKDKFNLGLLCALTDIFLQLDFLETFLLYEAESFLLISLLTTLLI